MRSHGVSKPMNARRPEKVREKATAAQLRKMKETRDCPDPECGGYLERIDYWMHEREIVEEYTHKGGNGSCECECDGDKGFLRRLITNTTPYAHHFLDRTEGSGCLKGEL